MLHSTIHHPQFRVEKRLARLAASLSWSCRACSAKPLCLIERLTIHIRKRDVNGTLRRAAFSAFKASFEPVVAVENFTGSLTPPKSLERDTENLLLQAPAVPTRRPHLPAI